MRAIARGQRFRGGGGDFKYTSAPAFAAEFNVNATAHNAGPVNAATPVLRLKRGEDRRLASGHLWVFSNEIDTGATPLTGFAPGAIAELRSHREAFIGYVCVNPHALICARILSRDAAQPVDAN